MKKIGILFIGVLALLTSCDEDVNRDFIIEAEGAISTLDDAERLVVGSYEVIPFASVVSFNSRSSDNLKLGSGNRGQGIQAHSWQLDSTDGLPGGLWSGAYNVIDQVNRAMDAIAALDVADDQIDRRDALMGELLAIRALMHFELYRGFTPDYDDPSSPSAIVVDRVIVFDQNNVEYLERNTAGEMLALINSDLNEAEALLDPVGSNRYRFTSTAVKALRARVKLYENTPSSLAEAVTEADDVINQVPLSGEDAYFDLFRNDIVDGSELVFGIEKDPTDAAIGTLFTDTNNDIFFEVSDGLVFGPGGVLAAGGDDVRFGLILDFETERNPVEVSGPEFPVGKYVGVSSANPALHDHKILRSSEMLLIRAEANAKLGNLPEAQADIEGLRAIRGSVIGTPFYGDEATALEDIARERRLEMAYEGHRMYDLKRTGRPVTRVPADCTGTTPCELPETSGRFILPIPQSEIFANEAIGPEDQNPGY